MNDTRSAQHRHLFVVGCPRSGTTWMQLLLARHPDVVTSQETHLFAAYLGHLMRIWDRDLALPDDRRSVGLTAVITTDAFLAACRGFAEAIFAEVVARAPAAKTIVEKTPGHGLMAREILRVYPAAAFIHVIRDPRDVVCSLRSAGQSWGSHWAPTNVAVGASYWRRRVEAARGISDLTSRYHEVRYGDLLRDAPSVLAAVCEFAGLEADADFCRDAAEACRLDRLKRGAPASEPEPGAESEPEPESQPDAESESETVPWQLEAEPDGFFRKGRAKGWRGELTRGELRRVEYAASPLMSELGYAPATRTRPRRPLRTALREGLGWRLECGYRACRRWLMRL